MHNIKISIYNDIVEYCKINGIEDVDGYINNLVLKAFMMEKYGLLKKTTENKLVSVRFDDVQVNTPEEPKQNNKTDNNLYNE